MTVITTPSCATIILWVQATKTCCQVLSYDIVNDYRHHAHYSVPPLRSTVVRDSARGAGGRGSIPNRVTPKDVKWVVCASQLGAWH